MNLWAVPRLYRRAILIYLGTIVAPMAALVWLAVESLERQGEALRTQTAARLEQELTARTETAARAAFGDSEHPIVEHRFIIESGALRSPSLRAPLSDGLPPEFAEAYALEADGQFGPALAAFRSLLERDARKSLALFGIARCLDRLGRRDEALQAWRRLANEYADERDLSHRPYGITAAIEAGDTDGLFERIEQGRWDLPADQAAHFLGTLGPGRHSPYLERFEFARHLTERFQPPAGFDAELQVQSTGPYRVFYRGDGPDRVVGFSVREEWIANTLKPSIERELDIQATTGRDLRFSVGATVIVLIVLSSGVVLLLRDVSREARTNRMRAELVSSVSHELKTPITLVRLYSETLLRHPGFSDEDRLGFYRIMARESTRLGRLIDQVLTFSRVDRGSQLYHFEEGDLASVVTGVVDDYREYLEHAGFSLRQAVPDMLPPARFDGAAISQALLNLLDNAVKYSGKSRDIGVRVEVDGSHIAVEVEDHGVGIASADQERIFDRFYRVANGSGKGGYGIGLFLVRHIMEAHGGRAEVESEPGRGSRFRLVLPTAAA
jgi:signal transduction histidine kinase